MSPFCPSPHSHRQLLCDEKGRERTRKRRSRRTVTRNTVFKGLLAKATAVGKGRVDLDHLKLKHGWQFSKADVIHFTILTVYTYNLNKIISTERSYLTVLVMEIPAVRKGYILNSWFSLLWSCQYASAISELGRYSDVCISLPTSSRMKKEGENTYWMLDWAHQLIPHVVQN